MTAAPGIFIPAVTLTAGTDAGTDATRAASVGQPAATVNHVHVTLSDGGQMPSVGLGTWLTVGQACYDLVVSGLRAGLRHIDTSENYQNHEEIGRAMADSGVLRSEIFLADKLSFPQSYSAEGVRKSVGEALRKMKTEYIDLYMLHSIGPSTAARHEAWREMVALQKEGTLRLGRTPTLTLTPTLAPALALALALTLTSKPDPNLVHARDVHDHVGEAVPGQG